MAKIKTIGADPTLGRDGGVYRGFYQMFLKTTRNWDNFGSQGETLVEVGCSLKSSLQAEPSVLAVYKVKLQGRIEDFQDGGVNSKVR